MNRWKINLTKGLNFIVMVLIPILLMLFGALAMETPKIGGSMVIIGLTMIMINFRKKIME